MSTTSNKRDPGLQMSDNSGSEQNDQKVLHIGDQTVAGHWILRIMTRLRQCKSQMLREGLQNWRVTGLGDLAGAVATRLAMHSYAVQRVDNRLRRLSECLQADKAGVEECLSANCAYRLLEPDLVYELLIDINTFLFETQATFELTMKFLRIFFQHILHKKVDIDYAKRARKHQRVDVRWVEYLRKNRNLFIHATTAWPALIVTASNPFRFELVLLKRNVVSLENPEDYLSMSICREIYDKFISSFDHIEAWLIDEIQNCESR